jgi:glucokinase
MPVIIDSDRACSILGEVWKGNAVGCRDAIFIAVGTGIGAGILVNGKVLRGSHDIAGATGWMALDRPFKAKYTECGCFEYHASGEGMAKVVKDLIENDKSYRGEFIEKNAGKITSHDVISAWKKGDKVAEKVIRQCIEFWGMASANLVSLFNPEKIIFGGGIFGPLKSLIPDIKEEALKWAQPIGIRQVQFDASLLGGDAGVYGAGYLALRNLKKINGSG